MFGRALRCSAWELLGVALALLLLVLAYSHTGHLVRLLLLAGYTFLDDDNTHYCLSKIYNASHKKG